jgi:hypothetical protein
MSMISSIQSILFVSIKIKQFGQKNRKIDEKKLQMNPADRIHDKSLWIQNPDPGGGR